MTAAFRRPRRRSRCTAAGGVEVGIESRSKLRSHRAGWSQVKEEFVQSDRVPPGRRIWIAAPEGDSPRQTVVFLDGELYLDRVSAETVVDALGQRGLVPPLVSVFVSSDGPASRHSDYVCSERYADFLARDLLPFVARRAPVACTDAAILVGLSLSGLAAAHAALISVDFPVAICQSPSFWWKRERFAASVPEARKAVPALWVSVGDMETERGVTHPPSGLLQETSQLEACDRASRSLQAAGYLVSFRVFHGGHDPACWREDLALALPWAIGLASGRS
jgi:enterochelin esterase family protein